MKNKVVVTRRITKVTTVIILAVMGQALWTVGLALKKRRNIIRNSIGRLRQNTIPMQLAMVKQ